MNNALENIQDTNMLRIKQIIVRYVTIISVLGVTAAFAPNFNFESFPSLLLSAFCVIILDYLVSTFTEIHDMPIGRAIVGFVSSTVIIYMTQFIVSGYYISIFSSIIAALIYAVIDYFLPNEN